jgi:hypothetical protein
VLIAACLAEHVSCPARLSLDVANLRNSKVALALTRFVHVRRRRATGSFRNASRFDALSSDRVGQKPHASGAEKDFLRT